MKKIMHYKCRNNLYNLRKIGSIMRFEVPDAVVPWHIEFKDYHPKFYSDCQGKPWEDREINDPLFKPKWNTLDGKFFTLIEIDYFILKILI